MPESLVATDLDGVAQFRWVSPGGSQITGRLFVEHASRVREAWWARQEERGADADVCVAATGKPSLRLPKARTA
jgi:hypothetical protein